MTTAMEAFKAARGTRATRTRQPVAVALGNALVAVFAFLGRKLPSVAAIRTTALALGGFGFLSAAAWSVSLPLGLAAVGLSFLAVEYLSGGEKR